MARFPTVRALAARAARRRARRVGGLGYYSRARNLHAGREASSSARRRAARDRVEELRELPGIGPYTAGAIASIAFGERGAARRRQRRARARPRVRDRRRRRRARRARSALWALAGGRCVAGRRARRPQPGADGARRDGVPPRPSRAAWSARCARAAPRSPPERWRRSPPRRSLRGGGPSTSPSPRPAGETPSSSSVGTGRDSSVDCGSYLASVRARGARWRRCARAGPESPPVRWAAWSARSRIARSPSRSSRSSASRRRTVRAG